MSNQYAALSQLYDMYDMRAVAQLSGDTNSLSPEIARINNLLDMQAGELDSYLAGRIVLPIAPPTPIPYVLTKWVAVTTAVRLYARRADKPKEIESDEKWSVEWLALLLDRKVNLPGIAWINGPSFGVVGFPVAPLGGYGAWSPWNCGAPIGRW